MLIAEISPAAQIVTESNPFAPVTTEAAYMAAIARPYALGATTVNFQVTYGLLVPATEGTPEGTLPSFQGLFNTSVTLSGDQLTSWGIDDTIILEEIATVVGTTIVQTITVQSNDF
jgi:hypothetical protein